MRFYIINIQQQIYMIDTWSVQSVDFAFKITVSLGGVSVYSPTTQLPKFWISSSICGNSNAVLNITGYQELTQIHQNYINI